MPKPGYKRPLGVATVQRLLSRLARFGGLPSHGFFAERSDIHTAFGLSKKLSLAASSARTQR
jgi:hypothetical protein